MQRFEGKVAVVTGAGSGIGQAVSRRLAAEGASVLGHDIDESRLADTSSLIATEGGGTFATRVGDVRSRDECFALVNDAADRFGRLDILGNVAGIARAEHFADVPAEAWQQMLDINLTAPFHCAQAAIPHLIETSGCIVNIASNAGLMGQAYTVAYCATKGAIVNFTRALAMEFVRTGVRVNAIAPGGVETNLTRTFAFPEGDVDWDLVGRFTGFRGMAQADEIASLFAYLASDEARPIHGAIVSADLGITAG